MKEPCHERKRLISRLESAHTRIAGLNNQAMAALVRGDFAAGGSLSTELKAEREEQESIAVELKTHVNDHGC
jgi:hypothetical protein